MKVRHLLERLEELDPEREVGLAVVRSTTGLRELVEDVDAHLEGDVVEVKSALHQVTEREGRPGYGNVVVLS